MQNDILASLPQLTDTDLVGRVKALIARERDATAEIVAHLAELATRDVHLRAGYPSLYVYCRDALGLSEWEAYNRIEVAQTARRFPLVMDLLAQGAVSLTAVRLLAPHLTADNHREVLAEASGKRKAQIEVMVARLSPRPDVRGSVRRLPRLARAARQPPAVGCDPLAGPAMQAPDSLRAASSDSDGAALASPVPSQCDAWGCNARASDIDPTTGVAPGQVAPGQAHTGAAAPMPRATTTPLSPDRYKFQVTIGSETVEKIRLAKDMLGHALPSGDDAAILDRAFSALLLELAKKKFADTQRPRTPAGKQVVVAAGVSANEKVSANARTPETVPASIANAARTPPAAVKRAVWVRDLGRCAFVGERGHRCNERRFVEFHHVDPYALGGEATVEGIQLRCRRHNDYEGRLYFGTRRRSSELVPEQVRLSAPHSTA